MDGLRFDDMARRLGGMLDRRRVVASLLGVVGAAATAGGAEARVRCRGYDASCTRSAQCCTAYCETSRQEARRRRNRCVCPGDLAWCAGACVALTTSANCGTCGEICTGQEICLSGACVCQPDCDGKCGGDDGCGGECPGAGKYWVEDSSECVDAEAYCRSFEWAFPDNGGGVNCQWTLEQTVAYTCEAFGRNSMYPKDLSGPYQKTSCTSSDDCNAWIASTSQVSGFEFLAGTQGFCATGVCQSAWDQCFSYNAYCVVQIGGEYTEQQRSEGVCF